MRFIWTSRMSLVKSSSHFDYALAICTLPLDQSSYRLQTLIQYQRDKLGHIDLELLAYLERTCVTSQPPQLSHVHALYEIYKMIKLPLKSKLSRRVELQHRLPLFFSLSLSLLKSGADYVSPRLLHHRHQRGKKRLSNVLSTLYPRSRPATIWRIAYSFIQSLLNTRWVDLSCPEHLHIAHVWFIVVLGASACRWSFHFSRRFGWMPTKTGHCLSDRYVAKQSFLIDHPSQWYDASNTNQRHFAQISLSQWSSATLGGVSTE